MMRNLSFWVNASEAETVMKSALLNEERPSGKSDMSASRDSLISDSALQSTLQTSCLNILEVFLGPSEATFLTAASRDAPDVITEDMRDITEADSLTYNRGSILFFFPSTLFLLM